MNNEAFRKLVQERATTSNTREFARQAVQAEFRRKRKRRKGGGDDDDNYSTDEDEDDGEQYKKGKQRRLELQPTQARAKKDDGGIAQNEGKYRDRAKERREGKLPEEGDELVSKSEEEEEDDDDDDQLDAVLEAAEKGQIQSPDWAPDEDDGSKTQLPKNETEAREWIRRASSQMPPIPKTALGREMLSFLRSHYLRDQNNQQKTISVTPAGRAIQRSTLTFSLRAFPGDAQHAWEVPSERTYATEHPMSTCQKASPITQELLAKLRHSLQRQQAAKEREKRRVVKPSEDSLKQQAKKSKDGKAASGTNNGDDSDDDEIFGGAGDYDPTEAAEEDDNEQAESGNKEPMQRVRFSDTDNANNRPVGSAQQEVGSRDTDRVVLPRLSKVSGYDEEVDMDFEERAEEDDSDDDDKKKKRKKAKRKKKDSSEADLDS